MSTFSLRQIHRKEISSARHVSPSILHSPIPLVILNKIIMVKGDFVGWGDEGTPTEVEGINAPLNNYNQMNFPAIVVINIFRIYWT